MEVFKISDLTFTYKGAESQTLRSVSLEIAHGEFTALCGPSGCGKSTLLRQLKPGLAPEGRRRGDVMFKGRKVEELRQRESETGIGFVYQMPEEQLEAESVEEQLELGMRRLGWKENDMRRKIAEMAAFFGMENWFGKKVSELSGGQKQLLNLASIMSLNPDALILDEPTSQLDPIAASHFLSTLGRINRELGTTVIITEHRLEEVFPFCGRVLVMDGGRIIADGTPRGVGEKLNREGHTMFLAMPTAMRVWAGVKNSLPCPVTVRDGREWLEKYAAGMTLKEPEKEKIPSKLPTVPSVEVKDAWFRYERELPDIVKGVSLRAYPGEFLAILGGNGTGKSTTLSLIAGRNRPYRGKIKIGGRELKQRETPPPQVLSELPQDPRKLFTDGTIRLRLEEGHAKGIAEKAELCRIEGLLDRRADEVSGGELQRAALARILLDNPRILLLDEPTKGLDAEFKLCFAQIMEELLSDGVTVIMVSHDVEFCASHAHRCAMFFDGGIVAESEPREFFAGNNFYTTSANRMARCLLPMAMTAENIIAACL